MRLRRIAVSVTSVLVICLSASLASAQAEKRSAGGEKSITGCLMKSGSSYVIQAQDGTYELNTDRDLSSIVGKKVRIDGKWETTGTFTTAPVTGNAGAAPATEAPSNPSAPSASGPGSPAFVGDLHLHITGTVVGDCDTAK